MSKSKKPKKVRVNGVRCGGFEHLEAEPKLGSWLADNLLKKDLAYLQVCVAAMGERLDMLEAENTRLRSMWGGTTHTGQPYWVASVTTGKNTITA